MVVEAITHPGLRRQENEDRFLIRNFHAPSSLLVVADGMGGHAGGEVAAQLAIETLANFAFTEPDRTRELVTLARKAHEVILETAHTNQLLRGMGTTLSAVFLSVPTARWVHVGDTRIYLFHEGVLTQITDDHTVPGVLLKKGEISKEQAWGHPYSNVLVRCVGCHHCEPDTGEFTIGAGDLVMITSDGLHDLVPEHQIAAVLSSPISLREKLEHLLELCLKAGGRDNITALLASI
jgi:protein phosphatase